MYASRESRIRYRVIDRFLSGNREATLAELAAACSEVLGGKPVDGSVIIADIRAMMNDADPGYLAPVATDPVTGKFRYTDPEYSIEKLPLGREELLELSSAASLLEQLSSRGLMAGLGGMVHKLVDAANINNLDPSGKIWDYIEFESIPAFTGSKFLEPVINAISLKKVLKLFYKPYEEEKPYFTYIHPYLLKEYRYRWYLMGLNEQRKSLRTYALDRIWEVEVSGHTYIPPDFNTREYFRNSLGVIVPAGDPADVFLEVRKPQAWYLVSQPLHRSQLIQEETEEHIVFTYHVHITWEFKSAIRALGSEAKILKPGSLRNEMIGELRDILANYGDPG